MKMLVSVSTLDTSAGARGMSPKEVGVLPARCLARPWAGNSSGAARRGEAV